MHNTLTLTKPNPVRPPSLACVMLEMRWVLEASKTALLWPFLKQPKLSGVPVMVLPGFCAGDMSTLPLRMHLRRCGAKPFAWELGVNRGPKGDFMRRLAKRVREIVKQEGQPVTLVGWSLGGVMARLVASRLPGSVAQVITLGSPLSGDPNATRLAGLFNRVCGPISARQAATMLRQSESVPVTSIYSRTDGVVAWQAAAHASGAVKAIEVDSTHLGMAINAAAMRAVVNQMSLAA